MEINLKDYLDEKFDDVAKRFDTSLSAVAERLGKNEAEAKEFRKSYSEAEKEFSDTLTRLTKTVEDHEKRSTMLEEEFRPIRAEAQRRKFITQYKKQRRKEIQDKVKFPGLLLGAGLTGTGAATYFWEWIKQALAVIGGQ